MISFHSIFVMLLRLSGDDMVCITLTQGKVATLDLCDWHKVKGYSWHFGANVVKSTSIHDEDGNQTTVYLHRIIMNAKNGMVVDHINHNTLCNERKNLRICTPKQNSMNRMPLKDSSSKFLGVYYMGDIRNRWRVQIGVDGLTTHVGCFKDEEEAARAYDKKALEIFGEFANLNFPT